MIVVKFIVSWWKRNNTMRCGGRATGAAVGLLFVALIMPELSSAVTDPTLEILPSQSVQTKPVGKSLLLTCRPNAADTKLITDLQWRDNQNRTIMPAIPGKALPPMYTEVIPGETSLALFIPSLTEAMAGTYFCSASYANNIFLRASVTIETIIAITFKDAPENQYPINGQNYKVRCDVTARPPPTVDWLKNGEQILTAGRYVVEARGLLIKNIKESDDGIYTCRAAVIPTGELDVRNIRLEVHTPPQMEPMQSTVEVLEGETASITCKAFGKPPPVYSWIKENTQQNLATADRFSVNQHTGVLSMNRVEQTDFGTYTCIADNGAGNAEASTIVEVLVKPRIEDIVNVTGPIKSEKRLICKSFGRPAPSVTFRKLGTKETFVIGTQANNNRIILDQEVNADRGETTGILTFMDMKREDDGLYECLATNKAETARKNGHLIVEFPPSFEASKNLPPIWTWGLRPANISCLAESIPNATIEWRFNDVPLIEDRYIKIYGSGPASHLIVVAADPRYYTHYHCIATNILGREVLDLELRRATPPGEILQSKLELITATSITFSLIGPGEEYGLPILAYTVQYKEDRNYDWNLSKNKTWSDNSPYVVENLAPMTTYNFRFAARNQVGLGPWGAPQIHTMPKRSAPEPPRLLLGTSSETGAVQSPYADHFEMRWKIPADNGEPIDSYDIKYCPVRKVNGEWETAPESECQTEELKTYEMTTYELRYLQPDTYYNLKLRAHNIIGFSSPVEVYLRTARGADTPIYHRDGPALSSTTIIAIVVGGVIICVLLIDLLLFCFRKQGLIATLCGKRAKKHDDDETKLGRDEKEPLKDCNDRTPVIDDSMKRNCSVEFDGRNVYSTTGNIIGKNSAV